MNSVLSHSIPGLIAGIGDDLAPVIVSVMLFMIPIVAILTSHQRKMAKIMQESRHQAPPQLSYEAESMKSELAELKSLMHQQAIAIDNLAIKVNSSTDIGRRLENVGK